MTTMLKRLNFLNLTLFLLISFVAPYISAKGASFAFSQNPEECAKSLEKDFFDDQIFLLLTSSYPTYLELKPQNNPDHLLRPPRFS